MWAEIEESSTVNPVMQQITGDRSRAFTNSFQKSIHIKNVFCCLKLTVNFFLYFSLFQVAIKFVKRKKVHEFKEVRPWNCNPLILVDYFLPTLGTWFWSRLIKCTLGFFLEEHSRSVLYDWLL